MMNLLTNIRSRDTRMADTTEVQPRTLGSVCARVSIPKPLAAPWLTGVIKDQKLENYQLVVPTLERLAPRPGRQNVGLWICLTDNTPIADPEQPLEILRTVPPSTRAWYAPCTCMTDGKRSAV